MKANYHAHTVRCGHASGTEEEYVRAALDSGFELLGFSDHAPWPYRNGYVSRGVRMFCEELPDYIRTVRELKRRYEGQLQVLLGLEAEYYPRYMDHLLRMRDAGIGYFLLGQHALDSDEDSPWTASACQEDDDMVLRYADTVAAAMDTGLYAYIAHPDIFMRRRTDAEFTPACERAADVICQAALAAGIPLEYNLLGLRCQKDGDTRGYPNSAFWRYITRWQVPAILGVDAHAPAQLLDTALWQEGHDTLTRLGFTIQETVRTAQDAC